ncbi:TetR/AcrR family transcriptional regulator [Streptococcus massiliensis]|uniref:Putative transcriptional regulator n=1 Tax=Streptococcus massiliensis TaxID=313439 RepID=A0A380KXW5_9STRE|nr:TetR/AcrR family transcriptional regulator [Streptococcus massiliensis]SUN75984.1 putative transcriptional regulator [Streptococcus massiliensis]
MYQGNNKIALASKQQIMDTFLNLLKQQAFVDISISLICRQAKVSRQTFYSIYQSKENIILNILQEQEIFALEQLPAGQVLDLAFFCSKFSFYLKGNTAFLKLLNSHHLLYLLYETLYDELKNAEAFLPQVQKVDRDYAASFLASALMGITNSYIQTNGRQSQTELANKMLQLFQGNFLK